MLLALWFTTYGCKEMIAWQNDDNLAAARHAHTLTQVDSVAWLGWRGRGREEERGGGAACMKLVSDGGREGREGRKEGAADEMMVEVGRCFLRAMVVLVGK